jgi:integrase
MARRGKGPRLVYLDERGYYVRWTEDGRTRQKSCGTRDQREAEEAFADFLSQRGERKGPRDPARFAIVDSLRAYGVERAPHTAAPARVGYAISALVEFWGDNFASDVTESSCRAYWARRGKAPGTIRRELGILRAALRHAEHHGRLTRAPHVWLPPKPPGKDRWLTRSEMAALLRAARQSNKARLHLPLFILIALYTGARKGAILSLRWPQVDLERGRIDFNAPGRAQTIKRRPVIPIPRRLMTFLRLARQRSGPMGYVVHRDGRRIRDIKKSFGAACERAGLVAVTPHTLRHTAGTWMAQRGVPLWDIAGYLGHSHERTSALYSHHSPDFLERARQAFD